MKHDKDDWYIINDFESFIDSTRALVFNNFANQKTDSVNEVSLDVIPEEQEELDRILSHSETTLIAKEILKKQTNKINKKIRYLVSDDKYQKLIEALHHRMIGNLLHSLVNKGLIESSFDEEVNDFVFWIKDDKENNRKTD